MNFTIIQADASHAAAITTIGKKSFRQAFQHQFNCREELFDYLEYTYCPVKLANSIRKENNVYFLAVIDDVPTGFAKVKKQSLNEQIKSGTQMELQKLYVLPMYQGKGIGKALLQEVNKLSVKVYPDYIWLDTHVSNEKAIHLYTMHGFKKAGKKYFTIGTQVFEYHIMVMPVAIARINAASELNKN